MNLLTSRRLTLALVLVTSLLGACPSRTYPRLCLELAERCGGAHRQNWLDWCGSECLPASALEPCEENAACMLCAPDEGLEHARLFAFPADELEFLFSTPLGEPASVGAANAPATGGSFDDHEGWMPSPGTRGPWRPYATSEGPLEEAVFCEPGPNAFRADLVSIQDGALVLSAERWPAEIATRRCNDPFCESGPYAACGAPTSACQYGDVPERVGYGTASQLTREATYGFGSYRAILRAGGTLQGRPVDAQSGMVYAFFSQSSEPCSEGVPNPVSNTAEIDVELTSANDGTAQGGPYCGPTEMCFIVSTWTSSTQGLPNGSGQDRHRVSGFRFRDRRTASQFRTYGYDWRSQDVRFTYDASPDDCDERDPSCTRGSRVLCEHRDFIPQRPSPLLLQLWNAWWAGPADEGDVAAMTVRRVWHQAR